MKCAFEGQNDRHTDASRIFITFVLLENWADLHLSGYARLSHIKREDRRVVTVELFCKCL